MADVAPSEGEPLQFAELSLSPPILRGLAEHGFTQPSPIQSCAIPLGRFGVDLIAQAKSGTGKTLVFVAIALELVQPNDPGPQALIVSPTREITLQSRDVCRAIGSHMPGLVCHAFVGGTPMKMDVKQCAMCSIACGTPGRLVGLLLCEALVASRVRLLVLDEADKLCDEGFESQLRYLLTALPQRKQSLAFSATYPPALLETLRASMRSPLMVSLLPHTEQSKGPGGGDGGGGDSAGGASSRGDGSGQSLFSDLPDRMPLMFDGVGDDPQDPLELLERPETLGGRQGGELPSGKGVCGRAGNRKERPRRCASSEAASAADGTAKWPHTNANATGKKEEDSDGELVGRAALQNVKQCYRIVYAGGQGDDEGGGGSGGCRADSFAAIARAKQREVLQLLDVLSFHQAIVFCNQPEHASLLSEALNAAGFPAALMSGSLSQTERTAVMRRMRNFELRVLVATDLLARGVDFGRVTLVVHYGPPRDLPTYLHRVGRTGRYGSHGLSVLLLQEHELAGARALLSPLAVRVYPLPLEMPGSGSGPRRGAPLAPAGSEAGVHACGSSDDGDGRDGSHGGGERSTARSCAGEEGESGREDQARTRPLSAGCLATPKTRGTSQRPAVQQQQQQQNCSKPSTCRTEGTAEQEEPLQSEKRHASAEALERARERGRQRALERARQRAWERHGLAAPPPLYS